MALFNESKVLVRRTKAKTKSKIIPRSLGCQPASIKLQENTKRIITQNTNHLIIMYLYRGHSASTSFGKEGEKTKKAIENYIE